MRPYLLSVVLKLYLSHCLQATKAYSFYLKVNTWQQCALILKSKFPNNILKIYKVLTPNRQIIKFYYFSCYSCSKLIYMLQVRFYLFVKNIRWQHCAQFKSSEKWYQSYSGFKLYIKVYLHVF